MYVNREAGLLQNLHPDTTRNQQQRPSVRPGQGNWVAVVARPTASKRWRLDRKHGRRRPAVGVTTTEQQRPVRQGKPATRHGLSRRRHVTDVRPTTPPQHSTHIDSTTPVDGSTTARPSHSLGLNTPTTSTLTTVATVVRHRNSSATRAQFHSHCVSVIHINRLTGLLRRTLTRRSLKYLNSMTAFSQLSSHTDASATSTRWHRCTCTRPTVIRLLVTGPPLYNFAVKKQIVNPLLSRSTNIRNTAIDEYS